MGTNADTLALLTNALDRAAATPGPFWGAEGAERGRTADLLGTPALTIEVGADGRPQLPGSVLLAPAILLEVAIEELQGATGESREATIFCIRERVSALLPDDEF